MVRPWPSSPSMWAMARPMPLDAPVTSAARWAMWVNPLRRVGVPPDPMMGAMAEPRRRLPREQRRRTLLEAGRTIILEGGGYGELTMERVAQAAGVSKTLVYDHFAHRRELYLALLAEERVRLLQRLAPPLSHGDRETRVRETVGASLELMA